MKTAGRSVALSATVALLIAACGGGAPSAVPSTAQSMGAPTPLTIYGAASLKGALDRMKPAWESSHPGSGLTISTDSSAALEMQIEQGAPADVFLSADETNPKKLADKGLADGAPTDFAGNLLTVIVPTANPARITSPKDLARTGIKIIAAGDDVPITKYASQIVQKLAKLSGYPDDFAAAYAANVASKEENVKAVVAKVALGEGDAAIVYATDAKAEPKVRCRRTRMFRRVMPAWSRPVRPTGRRPVSSWTGSPVPTVRRSSPPSDSCRRRPRAELR